MMWYSWTSKQSFEEWHSEAKALLKMPLPGFNAETGEQVKGGATTEYTECIIVADNDVRAVVDAEIASDKLGTPCEAPPEQYYYRR